MTPIELLKLQADEAFKELMDSIEGLSEGQAWARLTYLPDEYLHSEGSIMSIVAHIAGAKHVYGSAAYRDLEVRWRDTVERLESFWPSWEEARKFLVETHEYWLSTWADEEDVTRLVKRFNGQDWPSWKIISTMSHHDSYHAGQIQLMRATLAPTDVPPPQEGDLWRQYCGELYAW